MRVRLVVDGKKRRPVVTVVRLRCRLCPYVAVARAAKPVSAGRVARLARAALAGHTAAVHRFGRLPQ